MLTATHTRTVLRRSWIPALLLISLTLLALPATAQKVDVTVLTSDITAVGIHDSNLVNPWGLSISPTGPWWVSDNGTGLSTLYDGNGAVQGLVVTIPTASGSGTGTPTGTAYNSSSTDFKVHGIASVFLFCTEDGTISGWYTGTTAFIGANNNASGAIYKGCTLGKVGTTNYMYLANFHAGTVDVVDGLFQPHSFGGSAFTDSSLPTGYAPFNVQNIGNNRIAVMYAKQNADKTEEVRGPGNGYVDVFDTSGNLIFRCNHNLYLNAPWGAVVAPSNFAGFANRLLIGNFGSGLITSFDATNGAWTGNMFNAANLPVQIDGLWAIAFGNGGSGGATNVLYFTGGAFDEIHGIFGKIIPHPGL